MDETLVSAGDIARLAGVGRSAVSNWRRRYADFPPPAGGTPAGPLFALADVETWLRAQGKLLEIPLVERAWQELRAHAGDDLRLAAAHADAGEQLAHGAAGTASAARLAADKLSAGNLSAGQPSADTASADKPSAGQPSAGTASAGKPSAGQPSAGTASAGKPSVGRLAAVGELADALGAADAFEVLLCRLAETQARGTAVTPAETAELMAALAGDAAVVLDPSCGTGELLLAAQDNGARQLLGQDASADSARLAAVRLGMGLGHGTAAIEPADALLRDAFPGVLADAVLCAPPTHKRAWEVTAADPRWVYGVPPRLEPELAWVQHMLSRLSPGGLAVALVPAAAAGRRPGRRIRAQLLRKGALRAVIALSAAHHLWLLRQPAGEVPGTVLMVAAADPQTILTTWRQSGADPAHDEPGVSRAVPIIDLLDDEVDLTPARHLSVLAPERAAERFAEAAARLAEVIGGLPGLVPQLGPPQLGPPELGPPQLGPPDQSGQPGFVAITELARLGYLEVMQAPARGDFGDGEDALLTAADVIEGRPAAGRARRDERWITVRTGDVVVAAVGGRLATRVAAEDAILGPALSLVRVDQARLDPHFVAGVLHSTANARETVTQTAGATRADIWRAQLPRLPLPEQRRYGDAFRRMAALQAATRSAATVSEQLAQLLADGVAAGVL